MSNILPMDVLIVGGGPVGLTAALLLDQQGISCTLIDQCSEEEHSIHPQAHYINHRTMEIFRSLTLRSSNDYTSIEQYIKEKNPPLDHWRRFMYSSHVLPQNKHRGGFSFTKTVDHFQKESKNISPSSVAHFSQNKLVPLLVEEVKKAPHVKYLPSTKCTGIQEKESGVTCSVQYKDQEIFNLEGKYVIAADGAHSGIRGMLGIEMEGKPENIQNLINIHFSSLKLANEIRKEGREAMLFFLFNSDGVGVIVSHDISKGEFVAQIPYYPPHQKSEEFTKEICLELLSRLFTPSNGVLITDTTIHSVKRWSMKIQVAGSYQSSLHKIFLAGDSCHLFPPAGGFGMNTGIQDVHNLVWKISMVLQENGKAENILKTYEQERKKVAISNSALSMENYVTSMKVPSALGLNPKIANWISWALSHFPLNLFPMYVKQKLLRQIFSTGLSHLDVVEKIWPWRAFYESRLDTVLADTSTHLQLQFPREDIGFIYTDLLNAWMFEFLSKEETCRIQQEFTPSSFYSLESSIFGRHGTLYYGNAKSYVPSTLPGSLMPHLDIISSSIPSQELPETYHNVSVPLQDLMTNNGPLDFYFIATGDWSDFYDVLSKLWVDMMKGTSTLHYMELFEEEKRSPNHKSRHAIHLVTPGILKRIGFGENEALIVRPDQHITWKSISSSSKNISPEKVFSFLQKVTGLDM